MEHTKGPWGIMNDAALRKPAFMEEAPGITIASPHNTEPICRVSGYLQPLEANTALIAAAPELLEAAQAARQSILDSLGSDPPADWPDSLADAQDCLRGAIAKATG